MSRLNSKRCLATLLRSAGAITFAVSVNGAALAGDCVLDRVVVDPTCTKDALVAGAVNQIGLQVFGPGGVFDVVIGDGGAGGVVQSGAGRVKVTDGAVLTFAYLAPDPLPASLTLTVTLQPRPGADACARGLLRAATGAKTFPVPSVAASECRVTFSVDGEAKLGALQFDADYSATAGDIAGCGESAVCVPDVAALAGAADDNATALLSVGMLSPFGFTAPADVLTCALFPFAMPIDDADFAIEVLGAFAPDGEPIVPTPAVTARVTCGATTTTTTLPPELDVCGKPCSGAGTHLPQASDALYVLRTALELVSCELCACDVDGSGATTATDSLRVLGAAIGREVTLECLPCAEPIATGCN